MNIEYSLIYLISFFMIINCHINKNKKNSYKKSVISEITDNKNDITDNKNDITDNKNNITDNKSSYKQKNVTVDVGVNVNVPVSVNVGLPITLPINFPFSHLFNPNRQIYVPHNINESYSNYIKKFPDTSKTFPINPLDRIFKHPMTTNRPSQQTSKPNVQKHHQQVNKLVSATVKPTITARPTIRSPAITAKPTIRSPTITTKPTTKLPTITIKPTKRSPTITTKPTTKSPTITAKPTTKLPTVTTKSTSKSPTMTIKPTIKSPTITTKPTTKSPITKSITTEATPTETTPTETTPTETTPTETTSTETIPTETIPTDTTPTSLSDNQETKKLSDNDTPTDAITNSPTDSITNSPIDSQKLSSTSVNLTLSISSTTEPAQRVFPTSSTPKSSILTRPRPTKSSKDHLRDLAKNFTRKPFISKPIRRKPSHNFSTNHIQAQLNRLHRNKPNRSNTKNKGQSNSLKHALKLAGMKG